MPNIAGPYTADVNGIISSLTLAVDSQNNLVNSTIGNFLFTSPISGTFDSATGKLVFVENPPFGLPFGGASYRGYVVPDQPPQASFKLAGVVDLTVLIPRLGGYSIGVVESGWIAFQGVNSGMTDSPAAVGPPPAQGYSLIENGQVKALGLAFDAQNNLLNSDIDGVPIKGLYDGATGKLTFFATTNPLPMLTIDSFLGYQVVNTANNVVTRLLVGVVNHIVVNLTGGTATVTTTEAGWWSFPNPQ